MATVFGYVDRVAGDPQDAEIEVAITWDDADAPIPLDAGSMASIHGPFTVSVNDEGYWSATLVPNDNITPADNAYKITETLTDGSSLVYYIYITNGASPTYWVGDAIIGTPSWED